MSDLEADYGSPGTGNGPRPWPRGVSMSDIEADYGSLGTGNGPRPWTRGVTMSDIEAYSTMVP